MKFQDIPILSLTRYGDALRTCGTAVLERFHYLNTGIIGELKYVCFLIALAYAYVTLTHSLSLSLQRLKHNSHKYTKFLIGHTY